MTKHPFPLVFAALVAAAPALAQSDADAPNPFVSEIVDTLIYGIYCAEDPVRRDPAPGTASGTVNIVPDLPEMRVQSLVVPAELGLGFGVLVELQEDMQRDVTVTVTHPPYADTGITTETWESDLEGFGLSLNGFTFDRPAERLPGTWTFSATSGDEVIYAISFEVVPTDAAPELAGLCRGAFLS